MRSPTASATRGLADLVTLGREVAFTPVQVVGPTLVPVGELTQVPEGVRTPALAAGPIPALGAALMTAQEGLVTPAPEAGILTSGTAHHPFANDG